jgi:aminobenzoyl-glutamate utilization protein B
MFRIALLLALAVCAAAADLAELKKSALAETGKRAKLVQEIVDTVFSFGELGFQEFETSRYLTALLEKHGFQVERGIAGIPTSWVATWGNGKPTIALMTDIDGIPRASQKPGVAYHDPLIEGAPGHGEGHNSGMAVNIAAALVVKELMEKDGVQGTLKIFPGVAEEQLATKAYLVRAGYFKDVDAVLFCHVSSELATGYGQGSNTALMSVEYKFKGKAAHAASPWTGTSALDAVELMNSAWNFKREHLRTDSRSHYVITDGGDQPNVVPSEATVWYFFRELDYTRVKGLVEYADSIAKGASLQTGTTFDKRTLGAAWNCYFNKAIAEAQQKNIEAVGMPRWSQDDQTFAKALQRVVGSDSAKGLNEKVGELKGPGTPRGGGSDDIGDVSWNVPTVNLRYPANVPGMTGHSWQSAMAMATPIAHKGSLAGAQVQALTVLDLLLQPQLIEEAWKYFREVQTKEKKYTPLMDPSDQPAIHLNKEKMDRFRAEMRKFYYDSARYATYLEQLGIKYPTIK